MVQLWHCWLASFASSPLLSAIAASIPQQAVRRDSGQIYLDDSSHRGEFSPSCSLFQNQRVVLVSVNYHYLDLFRNWLHYAKAHLKETERLVVMAEDTAAWRALEEFEKTSDMPFVVVEPHSIAGGDSVDASRARTTVPSPITYGTKDYGDLVWRRPNYILKLLSNDCTVLYVDIDTVWINDPFLDIGEQPGHPMYLVQDDSNQGVHDRSYLCTCFLYLQPTPLIKSLVSLWSQAGRKGANKNQFAFNRVLRLTKGVADFIVLPIERFPPGALLNRYPDASVVHANWVSGHDAKVCFLKRRGLWVEGGHLQCR